MNNHDETYCGSCPEITKGKPCGRSTVYANGYCKAHGGATPQNPSDYVGRAKDVWEKRIRRARAKSEALNQFLRGRGLTIRTAE